jgi:hypothetical protein
LSCTLEKAGLEFEHIQEEKLLSDNGNDLERNPHQLRSAPYRCRIPFTTAPAATKTRSENSMFDEETTPLESGMAIVQRLSGDGKDPFDGGAENMHSAFVGPKSGDVVQSNYLFPKISPVSGCLTTILSNCDNRDWFFWFPGSLSLRTCK